MDITHNIFYLTIPFLTFWCLVIQALYYLGPLRKFQDSVLLLTLFVSIGGFIITYIHPKYVKLHLKKNNEKFEVRISGRIYKLLDLAIHQLPLVMLLFLYNTNVKGDNLLLAFSVLLIYFVLADPYKVYSIDCRDNKGKHICSLLMLINLLLIGLFFLFLFQKLFN